MTQEEQFESVITDCYNLFERKLRNYGASWRAMRLQSINDQIFIKVKRIRNLENKNCKVVDENIEDNFMAIVNYGTIGLIQLEKGFSDMIDLSNEEVLGLYVKYIKQVRELAEVKNHDYGEAWKDMRISSYTDIILTKILRLKQMENSEKDIFADNYMDIINYALFALIKN